MFDDITLRYYDNPYLTVLQELRELDEDDRLEAALWCAQTKQDGVVANELARSYELMHLFPDETIVCLLLPLTI